MTLRLIFSLLMASILVSCSGTVDVIKGSGKITTEEKEVSPFTKIVLDGVGLLELATGDKDSLTIETDDNLQHYVHVKVEGETLHLGLTDNVTLSPSKVITYRVTAKMLNSLDVSGAATVTAVKPLKVNNLSVNLSGAGKIDLNVEANDLSISLSGSGNLSAKGSTSQLFINVSGAGQFKGFDLAAKTAEVSLSGVGNAEINASDRLDATISGVGSVLYKGTPALHQKVTGVGALRHVGE